MVTMAGSPLSLISNDQRLEIIQCLDVADFKSLRLVGSKDLCLSDPSLTSHLRLRMDKAPFFLENDIQFEEGFVRRWLENRRRLVLDDSHAKMSPSRVAYLSSSGFLDSVSEVVIRDCRHHRMIIEALSHAPNIKSLTLIDSGDQGEALDELESIIYHVGANMPNLSSLDVEFDTVIHGSRLTFLTGLRNLRHLRLVGFDLSEGIGFIGGLTSLETLRLCHGNFYSSPSRDVNEKEMTDLIGLKNLRSLHLEGFDCMTGVGLAPFCSNGSMQHLAMKHCQESRGECLEPIGQMTDLRSLHFVSSSCDDAITFDEESLRQLNTLASLESLSLFYALNDPSHLRVLTGLTALRTLNVAFDGTAMDDEGMQRLCTTAVNWFPSLRKLRIFSEDAMECSFRYCGLDVEFSEFSFGDEVVLD